MTGAFQTACAFNNEVISGNRLTLSDTPHIEIHSSGMYEISVKENVQTNFTNLLVKVRI